MASRAEAASGESPGGVVDEDVDTAKSLECPIKHAPDIVRLGEIGLNQQRSAMLRVFHDHALCVLGFPALCDS